MTPLFGLKNSFDIVNDYMGAVGHVLLPSILAIRQQEVMTRMIFHDTI